MNNTYINKSPSRQFPEGSYLCVLTLSDHPTDVTESPSTDKSHNLVTWGKDSTDSLWHIIVINAAEKYIFTNIHTNQTIQIHLPK